MRPLLRKRLKKLLSIGSRTKLNRFNADTPVKAAQVLATLASAHFEQGRDQILILHEDSEFCQYLYKACRKAQLNYTTLPIDAAQSLQENQLASVACIVLGSLKSNHQFRAAAELLNNPLSKSIAMEYIAIPGLEHAPFQSWDPMRSHDFISPILSRYGNLPYKLFEESLQRFRYKTEIRDYLDLCALLRSIEDRNIPGNVAEFGSFRGHSGYLISRTLEEFGSDKHLFMFDMFEHFPEESAGVDRFWSGTHHVDFSAVKAKFSDRNNVQLVKGDFTKTLSETETGPLALAYIDCDSFRATRHVLEEIWNDRLSPGGIVIMEDYGHAALLGNRLACHQFFDNKRNAYTYFSQFSGFFVAVKTDSSKT